jgi:hypothetical protein
VVLQENNHGSTVETFRQMIEDAGLQIVFADGCSARLTTQNIYYCIGLMRRSETAPAWAITKVERVGDPAEARGWLKVQGLIATNNPRCSRMHAMPGAQLARPAKSG